jgi:hypothetical protein
MKLDVLDTAVAAASYVVILVTTPAFAQSSATEFGRGLTSLTSVREYVATEAVPRQLSLPANLTVSPMYRPLLEDMLRQSATFRRQCLRIAGEPQVTIQLKIATLPWRSDVRAQTEITRQPGGRLDAFIQIFPLHDNVELIAHEIEHVIEQLDEVDLASRARLPDTGVRSLSDDRHVFETTRALRVGQKVTGEVLALSRW